jgi:hypothetical protein
MELASGFRCMVVVTMLFVVLPRKQPKKGGIATSASSSMRFVGGSGLKKG